MHFKKAALIFALLIIPLEGIAADAAPMSEEVPKYCIVCFVTVEDTIDELCDECFKKLREKHISFKGARLETVRFDDLPQSKNHGLRGTIE